MTSAIRTTRNSRTKIFAACPAKIFAAGSNAGKKPLRVAPDFTKTKRFVTRQSRVRFADAGRTAAPQRSPSAFRSHPAGLKSSQGLPQSRRDCHPEHSEGSLFGCNLSEPVAAQLGPAFFGDMLR